MTLVEPSAWAIALLAFGVVEMAIPRRMLLLEEFVGLRERRPTHPTDWQVLARRALGAVAAATGGLAFLGYV